MSKHYWTRFAAERLQPLHCVYGVALVGLVTALGEVAPRYVAGSAAVALMYLLTVLVIAVRFGLWPALITAAFSVAALDYLFIEPLYTFEVDNPQDILLLALLAVVAVIGSGLAARLRDQVVIAERNAETTAELYRFAGKLAGTLTLDAAICAVVEQVAAMLPCRAAIFLAGEAPRPALLTLPLGTAGEPVGLMTITAANDHVVTDDERRLIEALAELAGISVGRQVLADRLAQMGIEKEADRLRSALLDSIAHDLTAPIASVATALTTLADIYESLDDQTRRELIADAEREAKRLHQFSANLIQIARVEAGVIDTRRAPTDIGDLVGNALVRAGNILAPRHVVVDIPSDLPPIDIDFVLMEQAIFHILENAGKYTPSDTTITIIGDRTPKGVVLKITDDGPGFPAEDSERIFRKFYRAKSATGSGGTGLGLAICRGFIEAHGGTITAKNRTDRSGAIFTILLPQSREVLGRFPTERTGV
jgi:two-component system, OmpR family, sensor histidine kinase KdpD